MSQVQGTDPQTHALDVQENASALDFDSGFNDGEEAAGEKSDSHAAQDAVLRTEQGREQDEQQVNAATTQSPDTAAMPSHEQAAKQEPIVVPSAATTVAYEVAPQPEPVKKLDIPEDIRAEYEELKGLSPDAAALAEEDSPEGQAIRKRLEQYGADSAMDRADIIMGHRRNEAAQRAQQSRAIAEHNANFNAVLHRELPDIMDMVNDKTRMQETAQFYNDVKEWIEGKPYTEAAPLMQIYAGGRDPHAVAGLIKRYQKEKHIAGQASQKPSHDPNAALAVPGRGAPVAPTGIGDKNDFDAGWNLE